jgi:NAD(P)-dependent dehydrogenase (short-subunit alcohol dehydrogenase family)
MGNKTVLVTGTNSGFGLATVERFHAEGWNVVATLRKVPATHPFAHLERVRIVQLELNAPESISAAADAAISHFGGVDVLINNAGYFQMGPLESSTMEQVRAQFETNFFGLVALTKAFIPHMRERGGGSIINLSSLSAENGYPFASVYSASKAAVMVLTEALNLELDAVGICVKAVLPGLHATRIFTKIDAAATLPEPYRPLLSHFLRMQRASGGSRPEGVAEVVFRAATDGRKDQVRYFAGADATGIPLFKRLLGQAGYFRFFRRTVLNGPGPLVRRMAPRLEAKVDIDPGLLERWR